MAAISLFGDTNMAAVTSCEIQELLKLDHLQDLTGLLAKTIDKLGEKTLEL